MTHAWLIGLRIVQQYLTCSLITKDLLLYQIFGNYQNPYAGNDGINKWIKFIHIFMQCHFMFSFNVSMFLMLVWVNSMEGKSYNKMQSMNYTRSHDLHWCDSLKTHLKWRIEALLFWWKSDSRWIELLLTWTFYIWWWWWMFLFFGGGVSSRFWRFYWIAIAQLLLVKIGFFIDQVAADMKVLHLTVFFGGGWVASNDFEGSAG